jgi:hypothetical protein
VRGGVGAVLLLGPSGAGKSLLALRLVERGWLLVADDRVALRGDRSLIAAPPPPLAGLIEVRGVGIVRVPWIAPAPVLLVADLAAPAERVPEPMRWRDVVAPTGAGADLPYIGFDAAAPAAEHRLEAAFARVLEAA